MKNACFPPSFHVIRQLKFVVMKKQGLAVAWILVFLNACHDPKKVKLDWEANRFYAEYVRIYNGYGNLPYDSTKQALQSFLKEFPNDAKSWAFLGKLQLEKDSLEAAKAAYKKALEFDTSLGWAYAGLGVIENWQHHYTAADSLLRKAQATGDSSLISQLNLAVANLLMKKDAEAKKIAVQIAAQDTLDDFFIAHLVVLYSELNDKAASNEWAATLLPNNKKVESEYGKRLIPYQTGKQTAIDFFNAQKHSYDGRK